MIKKITNLIFEAFHLKQIKHEGSRLAGVQFPDSVAEHSLCAAQIGYLLAKMEGADANKVAAILVWHDIGESRIGDFHKVAARYIKDKKELEKKVMDDQFSGFDFKDELLGIFGEYESRSTKEGILAKDADYLEQAFQAKIYIENGNAHAMDWIVNVGNALKSESAKAIWKEMTQTSYVDWWKETKLKDLSNT